MENLKVRTTRRHRYGGKPREIGDEYFVDHPKHLKFLVITKQVKQIDVEAEEARKKALSEAAKKAAATRKRNQQQSRSGGRYERRNVAKSPENKRMGPVKNEDTTKKR